MKSVFQMLRNPFKMKLFLLSKLPMGLLAGLHIEEIDEAKCIVSIRYKYLTKNPFRSIYFACLGMAGELASGALGMASIYNSSPAVSMLVVHMEADFMKKAVGKIKFTCTDGAAIRNAVEETKRTGEGVTLVATSTGIDEAGEKVAEFRIRWSYKVKRF